MLFLSQPVVTWQSNYCRRRSISRERWIKAIKKTLGETSDNAFVLLGGAERGAITMVTDQHNLTMGYILNRHLASAIIKWRI
jgi:hypothetical protein